MKKNIRKVISIAIVFAVLLSMLFTVSAEQPKAPGKPDSAKNFVVYYPNWAIYGSTHNNLTVGQIPWDKITVINHAFFKISDEYKLMSTDEWSDFQVPQEHSKDLPWGNDRGCFAEYKYYKTQYPNVKVLISVGGWTCSDKFHEMAASEEYRDTFIQSIIEFLKQYPFIDGIDLDWEYPGVERDGCPAGPEDKANFTTLLKEIRNAYNVNGFKDKLLTIAMSAGYDKIELSEPDRFDKYLDFINVMTYDIHGEWDTVTGHQSPLYANPDDPSPVSPIDVKNKYNVDYVVKLLSETYKIPGYKLNIGAPFYSHGWTVDTATGTNGLFADATGAAPGSLAPGQYPYFELLDLEKAAGFEKFRDPYSKVPWLYNEEEGLMYTYEDQNSIAEKCDYVLDNNLGGIMVWDIGYDDTEGFPMTSAIYLKLFKMPLKAPIISTSASKAGNYVIKVTVPPDCRADTLKVYEGETVIRTEKVSPLGNGPQVVIISITGKGKGVYTYKAELENSVGVTSSSSLEVTVAGHKK